MQTKHTKEEIIQSANDLLQQMTLKEKVWFLNANWSPFLNVVKYQNAYNPVPIASNGCERLNISPIKFVDGPRGVVAGKSTCFPVPMARGASFDRELEHRIGDAIGKEARAQNANYFGGVCINLLRHPAWGRAQETYGEDPYHVGEFGKALTESVQAHNVMACLKHYAVNSIENSRFRVNIKADERTLREVYLPHFKKSIDAGAASVMGAYNLYEGDHCCESDFLLNKVLREDWGFEGFTISDFFFGIRDGIKAINAGMDMEFPLPIHYHQKLLNAIEDGKLEEATIDKSVFRVLKTLLTFENTPDPITYSKDLIANKAHTTLALEAAEKSTVLLKNNNKVLPLSKDNIKTLLVVGKLAKKPNLGDYGSSRVRPPYVVNYLKGLKNYLGKDVTVQYCSERKLEKAKKLAAKADAVLIIGGYNHKDEGEAVSPDPKSPVSFKLISTGLKNCGYKVSEFLSKLTIPLMTKIFSPENDDFIGGDRQSLTLKPQLTKAIKAISDINKNTIVSLVTGSMIITDEWDNQVPSILYSWYAGLEGGNALPRLLFGDVNPSGKLPFVQPHNENDLPYFSSTDDEVTYDLYHGYTQLDKNNIKPAYAFGHGLSYTQFEYRNLQLNRKDNQIDVSVSLTNTGERDGSEVVQVYVGVKNSSIDRQHKLLKGFEKIHLKKGEQKAIHITIPLNDLRYFNSDAKQWELEKGTYIIYAGGSASEDQLLSDQLIIE